MSGACDRNRGGEKYIQKFYQKTTNDDTMLKI